MAGENNISLNVNLDEELAAALDAYVAASGKPRSKGVRELLTHALAQPLSPEWETRWRGGYVAVVERVRTAVHEAFLALQTLPVKGVDK